MWVWQNTKNQLNNGNKLNAAVSEIENSIDISKTIH